MCIENVAHFTISETSVKQGNGGDKSGVEDEETCLGGAQTCNLHCYDMETVFSPSLPAAGVATTFTDKQPLLT